MLRSMRSGSVYATRYQARSMPQSAVLIETFDAVAEFGVIPWFIAVEAFTRKRKHELLVS